MKHLFIFLSVLFFSAASNADTASYNVSSGKLHKGGSLSITKLPSEDEFQVKLNYRLKKRALVPIPSSKLKGEKVTTLPAEFKTEDGYLLLEKTKTRQIRKAKLTHLGRGSIGRFIDGHYLLVEPNNGKSSTKVFYHPQAPAVGWVNIEIVLKNVLNGYKIKASLK